MEKEFEYDGIIEIIEIIENNKMVEFADLVNYVYEEKKHERRYHMEVISDNAYMIVKYLESKKLIMERND